MSRPTRRSGSTFSQFKQRIPLDVRGKTGGITLVIPVGDATITKKVGTTTETIEFSLRTREPSEAKARQAIALAYLDRQWAALRNGPATLTRKQTVALAGEVYAKLVADHEDDPGQPEGWEFLHHLATGPFAGSGLQIPTADGSTAASAAPYAGPSLVDKCLARHNLIVDDDSKARLTTEVRRVLAESALRLRDNARGDYSPDSNAKRFPPVELVAQARPAVLNRGKVLLPSLVDDWWSECKLTGAAKPATYRNYAGAFRTLVKFLGHDDATRVTPRDIVAFKDHRLKTPLLRTGKPAC